MDIPMIRQRAEDSLSCASYPPYRLALLHTGGALLLSLVTTLASFLLTRGIDTTGGLSGLGTRTILQTVRLLVILAGSAAVPFWDLGYLRAALCTARGQTADPAVLPEGFRRFGICLRLMLLRSLLVVLITMVCVQLSSILYLLSPFSLTLWEQAQDMMTATNTALTQADMEALLPAAYPLYGILAVVMAVVLIPILYRLRLADWAVMDDAPGALAALRQSSRWMKGNRLQLFRLDLSFWWYYALQLLATAVAYGDLALPLLGIQTDKDGAFWVFYGLSLALQLVVFWRFAPRVQTACAHAYEYLRTAPEPQPKPQPQPQNLPWD